jgi:hypothetical protein
MSDPGRSTNDLVDAETVLPAKALSSNLNGAIESELRLMMPAVRATSDKRCAGLVILVR